MSHLFFVDNSLVFYKASIADYTKVKGLLGCYATTFDHKINMENLALTFNSNVHFGFAYSY